MTAGKAGLHGEERNGVLKTPSPKKVFSAIPLIRFCRQPDLGIPGKRSDPREVS
jgi:hypothetical protein